MTAAEVNLSIEVEDVERHGLAAFHAAADDALKARLKLQSVTMGGALVSIAGAVPPSGIVANRTRRGGGMTAA